ncbi:23298_t:CDS:1 [Racocetra persica]|uniref:23298_t:CDS:1 n=1 Tax=Racocetra persica TaxID=160502 RepID=A0ACA9P672_9GLOM|nr:23298_t:CDS:1 [Racocetra persica]
MSNNDNGFNILQGQNVDKVIQHSNTQLKFEIVETAIYHDTDYHDRKTTRSSEQPDLIDLTSLEGYNSSNKLPSEISISLKDLIGSTKKIAIDHNNPENTQGTVTKITQASQKSTPSTTSNLGESSKDQTFNEAKKALQLRRKDEEIYKELQIIKSPNSAEFFKMTQEEIKARKAVITDAQEKIRMWILKLWPHPRTLGIRQMTEGLTAFTLKKRSLNPLVVGVNIIIQSKPMILTATVTGTKYDRIDNCHKPKIVMDILDLRQYILKHCPTYQCPPIKNNDHNKPWDDIYFLKEILPKLTEEAISIQNQPGLLLTVKEAIIRGLEGHHVFECKLCAENPSYYSNSRFFNLKGIYKHLESQKHKIHIRNVYNYHNEDYIQVNPKEYVLAFSKELPPKILPLERKR